jgi:membrane protein
LILAIFPFIFLLITIVSYTPITSEQALSNLAELLPSGIYNTIKYEIDFVLGARSKTLLSFGMIMSIWVASNAMEALIKGLNRAYDKVETRSYLKVKLLSILFTFGLAVIFIFTFGLLIVGGFIATSIFNTFEIAASLQKTIGILRYTLPGFTLFFVFLIMYYVVPNRKLKLTKVIPGTIFSTAFWIVLSQIFSNYMSVFSGNYSKTYGSIGGIILVLIWMYWSSVIILIGGEINAALYHKKYKKINIRSYKRKYPSINTKKVQHDENSNNN